MARNLTRFDPLRDIMRFDPFRNMQDLLRELRTEPVVPAVETQRRILMDVSEDDQAYYIRAEMPGIRKEDINIDINGNQVTISAEIKSEVNGQQQPGNMLSTERYYGDIYRSFTLPQEVDESKAEAKYHDGILELKLPKKAGSGGKKLTVQ